jgi:hypothetical protein
MDVNRQEEAGTFRQVSDTASSAAVVPKSDASERGMALWIAI